MQMNITFVYFELILVVTIHVQVCAVNHDNSSKHVNWKAGTSGIDKDLVKTVSCAGEWQPIGERCLLFKIVPNRDHMSHQDAQAACKMHKNTAALASVHSQEENDFIYSKLRENEANDLVHVWLGMQRKGKGFPLIWEDGTPVDYVNWDYDEPNDSEGDQNCIRLYEHNGFWDDFACNGKSPQDEFHGYVCQSETPQIKDNGCSSVPNDVYQGCCAAGDVFAIIFGIIILIAIVVGVLGYLYYFRWGQTFPWQQSSAGVQATY